jgi:hypothetical protein
MSAAEKLVIVENSGSLAGLIEHSLLRGLESAAGGQAGCSFAFQGHGSASQPVSVKFFATGSGGLGALEGRPDYEEALASGGGGTYLNPLLGMALEKHRQVHGQLPSTIVFWSDFCDQNPHMKSMAEAAGLPDGAAWDFSKSEIIGVIAEEKVHGPQAMLWIRLLEAQTNARCLALPQEALGSLLEAQELRVISATAPDAKRRPAI